MNDQRTSRSIEEMRIDVLSRVAEACMVYDLPAPMDLNVTDYAAKSVTLRLDEDQHEQVNAWAEFLNLPAPTNRAYDGGTWIEHSAEGWDHSGGLWRGAQKVRVWCAVSDPEQVARLSALAVLGA